MPLNPFDDAIEQLDQAPAAIKAPENPFLGTIDAIDTGREQRLRTSTAQVADKTPERAAEVQRFADRLGMPAAVVERNFDDIKRRAALADTPYTDMLAQTPHLAELASDPAKHAAIKDDMEQLGALEWLVTAPQRAFAQGVNQFRYGTLRAESLFRPLSQADQDLLASYKFHMDEGGKLGAGDSWFKGAVTGGAQNLPNLFGAGLYGLKYGLVGALEAGGLGAVAGSVLPGAGTIAGGITGAGVGFRAGMIYGGWKTTAQLEAGLAYDEYLAFKDEYGQPLDPSVARAAALATGAINGGLELVGLEKLVESIPGVKKLGAIGVKTAIAEALRVPTVRGALFEAMKSYGSTLTMESAVEVAQRAVTILSGELAKASDRQGQVPGQLEKGNVNLFAQPRVTNADGSISTVDSLSVGIDGKEVLLPTVTPDGRHLKSPEEAIAEYKQSGKHLGVFDSPASATAFAQQLHEDYAGGKYDQGSKFRSASSIAQDLINEGAGAIQGFALTVLPGPALSAVMGAQQARRAQQGTQFFKALGEGAAASKTIERLPAAAQELIEKATKDGPIAAVYAPIETWNTYWQSKGLDPAEVAKDVTGNPRAYEQAMNEGADLAIPTARYATKLAATEHNGYFANELRLGPEEMNGREAAEFTRQQSEPGAGSSTEGPSTPPSAVRTALLGELATAGVEPAKAEHYANLYESAIGSLAERSGVDATSLYEGYGLKVQRPDLAGAPAGAQERRLEDLGSPTGEERRAKDTRSPELQALDAKLIERRPRPGSSGDVPGNAAAQALEADRLAASLIQTPSPAASSISQGRAVFLAHGPDGPLYNIVGGPKDRSTVSASALAGLGLAVPETPADTGERLSGEQIRARLLEARAAAVDKAAATPETGGADGGEALARRRADLVRDAGSRGVPASRPRDTSRGREKPAAREQRRVAHYDAVFADLLDAATTLDPHVDQAELRAEFNFRVDALESRLQDERESGHDATDLLTTIAGYGGINTDESTFPGEVRFLRDGSKFGTIAGVRKVFQKAGLSIDGMLEALAQDHRFRWVTNANILIDAIDNAIRHPPADDYFPGSGELWADVQMDPTVKWWEDSWRRPVAFDVSEFSQSLFDALETDKPTTDTLPTGEQQARLPGDAGAVREQEIATPAFEAPFALTSEAGKPQAKQKTLFQGDETKRGSIRFGADRQMTITLLQKADLSTFLHESGHFFLEVFTDLANQIGELNAEIRTPQQQQLLADHGTLMAALVDEDHAGAGISTKQHEQFAKMFEAYLFEGKAPSLALQNSFARFRAWLVGVYRSLKNLGVTLSDDVRGVMDRLVASDQAIADAEARRNTPAMFTTAVLAGMDEKTFALYKDTIAQASAIARANLDRKLLAEVRREQTAAWKAQRAEIQGDVENEVHARPEYRALAAMQKGEHPNGQPLVAGIETAPLKLSKQMLVERYGEERLVALPKPFIYTVTGGMDPNTVAELFGFSSGDAMLTAVEGLRPMKTVIQEETDRRMLQTQGSLLLDGTLGEKAQLALANEDRDAVIRAELLALGRLRRAVDPFVKAERAAGRATLEHERAERAYERRWFEAEAKLAQAMAVGRKQTQIEQLRRDVQDLRSKARGGAALIRAAIPPAGVLKALATDRIAAMPIGDVNPAAFWSASRRAAEKALNLAARQDYAGAIVAKQQELVNLNLYREAERVVEDVADRTRFALSLATTATRKRIGLAGGGYLEQIDGILDRYEFAKVPAQQLERRASLRKWVESLEAQGLPVELPTELLDETRRRNYKELTVDEFTGVTDGLKTIAHLVGLKTRLLKLKDRLTLDTVAGNINDTITAAHGTRALPLEFRQADTKYRMVADWFASHKKLSTIVYALDGFRDGGPLWEAFLRPLNAAADQEAIRKQETGTAYAKILEAHYPGRELATLNQKLEIPAIGGSLSKEARLAVALNWGNQSSRDRLLSDPVRKWTQSQVSAILDTLDERDWRFVQATFDHTNTFWAEIAAKQERVTGLAPEKVEALPIQTRFGELAGGYHPLAYDHRLSIRAQQHQDATAAKLATGAAYVQSTTKRGHVETRRSYVSLPIRLELGVAFEHYEQVIHDLTHHEALIDATRILRHPKVVAAILATKHGDITYQQLTRGVQDIAIGSTPPARTIADKAANFARQGTQIAGLGLNFWTAAQQPLGLFNAAAEIGPTWVARGMKRWLRDAASMENTAKWIAEVSPMMRERVITGTQDLHDLRAQLRKPGGWFDGLVRQVSGDRITRQTITDGYLWHIGLMQRVADIPTWLGAYEKAMATGLAKGSEERAIALADQAVLNSQGGGQIKDLAQVQRGGAIARLFMTFYSYGNTVANATARIVGRTELRSPASVVRMTGELGLLYMMPAVATVALSRLFGKSGGNKDDDSPEGFFADVARETLATALNTMIYVRELGGLVQDGARGYEGPAGARLFSLLYHLGEQIKQGAVDEGLWKAVNAAAGVILGYPAAQAQRTIDGFVALQDGKTSNPLALLVGAPPKKNKKK